ncbi:MAG: hypothetical protein ACE37F_04630 [Nannocystaceae bacterium]|nr:hypothetical protein [bacterium]
MVTSQTYEICVDFFEGLQLSEDECLVQTAANAPPVDIDLAFLPHPTALRLTRVGKAVVVAEEIEIETPDTEAEQ